MFKIEKVKGKKRIGNLETKNGVFKTPFFLPDATRGFVKFLSREDLKKTGAGPMVVNAYHLYLQPGIDLIKKGGGINRFMNWPYPLLADSGGYQIFSLIHKNPLLGKIGDNGVVFRSPIDGSEHKFTPEKTIQIQFDLGVDMMVVLDDCPPNNYPREKIKQAVERTVNWAERGMIEYKRQIMIRKIKDAERPLIFGVIQGGTHFDLRKKCAGELIKIGFSAKGGPALGWDGLGFGARHHDEEGNLMEDLLEFTASHIPENYLRFALGVGMPGDIVKCFEMGWDIFDCVIPTREGRHGRLFIWKDLTPSLSLTKRKNKKEVNFYETININNEKFKKDFSPIDHNCGCELCQNHTKSYLRHLFVSRDPLGMRLAAIHNLNFYFKLLEMLKN
jgi:queuine tRNA-ribosyltransferase